jgi:hypothetical protein
MGFIDFDRLKAPPSYNEGRDTSLEGIDKGIENHSFDLSTRDAINTLNADKNDGDGKISGKTFASALDKLADGGQISREEYADMREYVLKNYANLSDDAKKLWDKFDTAYQKASGGDVGFGDQANDGKLRSDGVLSGDALKSLLKDVHTDPASGYTPPKQFDGIDKDGPYNTGTHKTPSWLDAPVSRDHETSGSKGASGSESSRGSSGSSEAGGSESSSGSSSAKGAHGAEGGSFEGMSWEMIFALIMDKIDNAEKMAKGKAKELANKMDANTQAIQSHGEATKAYDNDMKEWQKNGSKPADKPKEPDAAAAGQGTESMNRDMSELQSFLDNLNKLVNMLTNLQKNKHDTEMAVVRNLAG